MDKVWTLSEARTKLSAVVRAAEQGDPQYVTKRGSGRVVLISNKEYERLVALDAEAQADARK